MQHWVRTRAGKTESSSPFERDDVRCSRVFVHSPRLGANGLTPRTHENGRPRGDLKLLGVRLRRMAFWPTERAQPKARLGNGVRVASCGQPNDASANTRNHTHGRTSARLRPRAISDRPGPKLRRTRATSTGQARRAERLVAARTGRAPAGLAAVARTDSGAAMIRSHDNVVNPTNSLARAPKVRNPPRTGGVLSAARA